MVIKKIKLKSFRNFSSLQFTPCSHFNLIFGKNGSGKTSLLEAIYVLGFGRSFRVSTLAPLIQHGGTGFVSCLQVEAKGSAFYLGMERSAEKGTHMKARGQRVRSLSQLIHHLPILFISPESFSLIADGPEARRKFIDWGTFYTEPAFGEAWGQFSQALKQRNAALKQGVMDQSLAAWDLEWLRFAAQVTALRQNFFTKFSVAFNSIISDLMPLQDLGLSFVQGWLEEQSLAAALHSNRAQDRKLGYTSAGPQRADLQITLKGKPAHHVLSRGQQKMLVCALYLAQGKVLADDLGRQAVYLIDDLSAELDIQFRKSFLAYLYTLKAQTFITGIEPTLLAPLMSYPHQSFHFSDSGELVSGFEPLTSLI